MLFGSCAGRPGVTIAAALTLAMAIGANAVVFSVLNGLILRPLNAPQAQSRKAALLPRCSSLRGN